MQIYLQLDEQSSIASPNTGPTVLLLPLSVAMHIISVHCWIGGRVGYMYRSEVVAVVQNLRSISSQAGLQLLNVLVTLTLSHRSFNYDTDHGRVWITLGGWHCGLETLCWDRDPNPCSLTSLHAPQVRALTTYTTVAMKWSSSGRTELATVIIDRIIPQYVHVWWMTL